MKRPKLWDWFKTLLSGKPHFYIGGQENPYMKRWYLFPRNSYLNLYLHQFLRDDDDRALHDHPWWFISIMLKGRYIEKMEGKEWYLKVPRKAGSIVFRKATHRHQVILYKRPELDGLHCIGCWTLVLTGPTSRVWGFWCPKGFVPWHEFVDQTDTGNIGKGCGE